MAIIGYSGHAGFFSSSPTETLFPASQGWMGTASPEVKENIAKPLQNTFGH